MPAPAQGARGQPGAGCCRRRHPRSTLHSLLLGEGCEARQQPAIHLSWKQGAQFALGVHGAVPGLQGAELTLVHVSGQALLPVQGSQGHCWARRAAARAAQGPRSHGSGVSWGRGEKGEEQWEATGGPAPEPKAGTILPSQTGLQLPLVEASGGTRESQNKVREGLLGSCGKESPLCPEMLCRNALPAQTFPGLGVTGINLKCGMLFMAVSVQQFLQQSNSFVPGGNQSAGLAQNSSASRNCC